MSTIEERYEAMRRRDVKRMTLAELKDMSAKLHAAAALFEDAARYESSHSKHPSALLLEEQGEGALDAAVLTFAGIRSRVQEDARDRTPLQKKERRRQAAEREGGRAMTLRVIRDSGDALDREALQQRGNELATQIKNAAADAIRQSMLPDVFTRGQKLTRSRMLSWRGQASDAIKAWQAVDGLISELIMEIDKSAAEELRGKKLVVVPDGSGKPGRFTTKYVDDPEP